MKWPFFDREDEQRRLRRFLKAGAGGLAVLYGRRRCGKSTLLQRTLTGDDLYFQADQRECPMQLEALAGVLSRRYRDFDKVAYRDWDALLASLYARSDHPVSICLDEFPYLVRNAPSLPSILQRYLDRPDGRVGWIVCGSSQRMMHGLVMSRQAPLYGRAREIIKIDPLSAGWLMPALGLDATAAVEAHAVWGGVPRYWELAADHENLEAALKDLVWNSRGVLHEEPTRLLLDDMRSAVQPFSILSLIGMGCHRPSEIAGRLGKPLPSLARPLALLCDLGYVRRDTPFGEGERQTRRSLYTLNDAFLRFYFRFVLPYQSSLAQGITREAEMAWSETKNAFVAACWEDLCRTAVPRLTWQGSPFGIAQRWWISSRNPVEIDLVAVSLDRKTVLLGECKWSERRRRFDLGAADRDLRLKARGIPGVHGKKVVTSFWLGGQAQVVGKIEHLFTPDNVMPALTGGFP